MKKTIIILLAAVFAFCFVSCDVGRIRSAKTYAPDGKKDLYTAAISNIFGAEGYTDYGLPSYSPVITVLETDHYGRVLFYYSEYGEDSHTNSEFGTAYVIMQSSDKDRVYYYQYDCYMPYYGDTGRISDHGEEKIKKLFDSEKVAGFKERNDWDKEIDLTKCTSTKIKNQKGQGTSGFTSDESIRAYVYECAKQNGYDGGCESPSAHLEYCFRDKNGLDLYKVKSGFSYQDGNKSYYEERYFALITDKNTAPVKIVEVTDPDGSYEKIKTMMEECGWIKPEKFDF